MHGFLYEVGLIRVITCEEPTLSMHARLLEAAYPGLRIESRCIPGQPEGIHSHEMELEAIPKIVALACEAFSDKDVILVSCAEDPGAPEIRAALPHVPVIGAGEAACAMALKYGRRVGVLGITDVAPKAYLRMLGEPLFDGEENPALRRGAVDCEGASNPSNNLPRIEDAHRVSRGPIRAENSVAELDGAIPAYESPMAGRLVANVRPHGVHSTLDLQTPEGRAACIEGAQLLKRLGSEVIALGCTGMATIGIARELEDATGLPVVDPVLAMGAFAAFEAAKKSSKRKPHRN